MKVRLIRHATLVLEYAGKTILFDPMLSDKDAMTPIDNSPNQRPNPLVEMPVAAAQLARMADVVLVSHTHRDHWDDAAARVLDKSKPLFGQPEDQEKFKSQGFQHVHPITDAADWNGIHMVRTGGQHGTGEIGKMLAPVSGFVFSAQGEPTLYLAGDTIWCWEVQDAIAKHRPDVIVVNAGGARFLEGDAITMTAEDVVETAQAAPHATLIADHMEAINHCLVTRADLARTLQGAGVASRVRIPADGEFLQL